MGYFFAGAGLTASDHAALALTPSEFIQAVASAMRAIVGAQASDTYLPGLADRTGAATLAKLSARVQASPSDATAHRMLGIAQLGAGDEKEAIRHLVIAADLLLRRCAAARALQTTLHAHLDLKLVGLVLVPVCLRRRMDAVVRRLLAEVLLVW